MGERREVAGSAERSLLGDHRVHLTVQEIDQPIDHQRTHARVPERQAVGPEQQHGPDLPLGQRRTDAHGVRAKELVLEISDLVGLQPDVRQAPQPGGDAVDGLAGFRLLFDDAAGALHALAGPGRELDGLAAGGRHHVLD